MKPPKTPAAVQNNPNLELLTCVSPNFIIHTPVLKIVADGESGVVNGTIKSRFSIYNEQLQREGITPRAQRVENKLEESMGARGPSPKQLL